MHAVVLEIRDLRISVRVDKESVDIEILGAVFAGDLFEKTVGVRDDVVIYPFQVDRQDALDHDRGLFVPGGQAAHDLAIGGCDVILLHGDIVDAGHEEDRGGVSDRRADALSPAEQAFDGFAGDAEIGHMVIGEPALPIEPFGKGVADKDEVFGHVRRGHGAKGREGEVLASGRLTFPFNGFLQHLHRGNVLEPPGLVLVHPSGDAGIVAAGECILPVYPDGGRALDAEDHGIVVVDGPPVHLGPGICFRNRLLDVLAKPIVRTALLRHEYIDLQRHPDPGNRGGRAAYPTWMTWTGQESAASCTLSRSSAGASPSAGLPPVWYFAVTWLQLSVGFCSKNSGQMVQHDSQLMHSSLVIVTFAM